MPIFEYICNSCNKRFELLRSTNDTAEIKCPFCGKADIEKIFSTFASAGMDKSSGSCGGSSGFS
ncbi:MAG: zinc ribbon domain-containing protein [candidate division Zixibacteria bacterium]|nr:zinc ribbon domain-containing protein [candidate division Zixibacteria bacterium]